MLYACHRYDKTKRRHYVGNNSKQESSQIFYSKLPDVKYKSALFPQIFMFSYCFEEVSVIGEPKKMMFSIIDS